MPKSPIVLSVLVILAGLFFYETPLLGDSAAVPTPAAESQEEFPEIAISITLQEEETQTYHIISDSAFQEQRFPATPMTLHFPAQLLSSDSIQSPPIRHTAAATGLVDNWEPLFEEDFEATFPQGPCAVYDVSNDGFERTWGKDNFRFSTGSWAGWPASAGADSVDPAVSNYPADLDSWLICGPFNLSYAQDFLVNFNRWMEINDADDHFFVGASTDGSTFRGLNWSGVSNWSTYHIWFQGVAGDDSVWVGWQFYSDGDGDQAAGVWLDALEVWRYNTPTQTCGSLDPGAKGIVLNPYEWLDNEELPIIRADDTVAADKLALAGVHWVRMVFRQRDSIVRHQEYDRIVETLCARGISVLGVVNHETLVRQDFNDPASAVDYRHEFTGTVGFIADRYAGRVTYWEVWN